MKREVWFDARDIELNKQCVFSYLYNSSIDVMVVSCERRNLYNAPLKTRFVVELQGEEDLELMNKGDVAFSKDIRLLNEARLRGYKTGIYIEVFDAESLENACNSGLEQDFIILDFKCETNIPLELVIARLGNSKIVILKKVASALDAEIAMGVMEKGSDGIMMATEDLAELNKIENLLKKLGSDKIHITTGKITGIQHIGMGYRACIDTTSILKQNEGMLIGSTSRGGILVSSETHFLPYMELRPFRVNAGAVHSYIWCPGDMTAYITELKSGSRVMVTDTEGNAREVSVGRVKIEVRPLVKIEADIDGVLINTIVQDDWHIRILGPDGRVYNATSLKEGDEVAAYICSDGRHVGIKINETIIEK